MRSVADELQVFEYGGTARSGKGSMVAWLSEVHPYVATDETGADYRAVTLGLLQEQKLDPEMDKTQVEQVIHNLPVGDLSDLAARRRDLEAEYGKGALYAPEVGGIVHFVSPLAVVRGAVKSGFQRRVEKVRDAGEHQALLVDGRNLAAVVEKIQGTRLVLKTFVFCNAGEAALRECARQGIDPESEDGQIALAEAYETIAERNYEDSHRKLDPVERDRDSINYWTSQDLYDRTLTLYADLLFDGSKGAALNAISQSELEGGDHTEIPRIGAGLKAVKEQRQIYFDTSPFRQYPNPKHSMLSAANTMFEEALRAHAILNNAHVQ